MRCAAAIRGAVRTLGLEIRTGLHTGECELVEDAVSGIALHIGARVMAASSAGRNFRMVAELTGNRRNAAGSFNHRFAGSECDCRQRSLLRRRQRRQ